MNLFLNFKKQKSDSKGFSLIEMLVVITIIGIIIIAANISRVNTLKRKESELTARRIKQLLDETKDYSLTGQVVKVEGAFLIPDYYQFVIDGDKFKIRAGEGVDKNIVVEKKAYEDVFVKDAPKMICFGVPHGQAKLSKDPGAVNPCADENTDPCSETIPCLIEVCGNNDEDCSEASLKYTIEVAETKMGVMMRTGAP